MITLELGVVPAFSGAGVIAVLFPKTEFSSAESVLPDPVGAAAQPFHPFDLVFGEVERDADVVELSLPGEGVVDLHPSVFGIHHFEVAVLAWIGSETYVLQGQFLSFSSDSLEDAAVHIGPALRAF